jgi:osmotically inducible protein OsmC
MPVRTSEATWKGDLRHGSGDMIVGDGLYQGAYSFASRFQTGEGTNPEELLAAAQAGCYSMALSNDLAQDGFEPERVHSAASVHLEDGEISLIEIEVDADVPGIDEDVFLEFAEDAKTSCPVSEALESGPDITLNATVN